MKKRVELHDSKGHFKKGNNGNGGGRKPGKPNKITTQLKEAILEAAGMVGLDGEGELGLHGYLCRLALVEPQVYGRLLEKLIPLQFHGTVTSVPAKYETLEDLTEALKARGLPPPSKIIDVTPTRRNGVHVQ